MSSTAWALRIAADLAATRAERDPHLLTILNAPPRPVTSAPDP
jgi:hypothetical protein